MRSKALQAHDEQGLSWFRLALIAIVAGLLGGAVALVMVALMVWLCQRSWVVDDASSHGISEVQTSRLGGVAVFLGAIAFSVVTGWTAGGSKELLSTVISSGDKLPGYMSFVFLIALVGLWDDFVARFQPILRLGLVLAISMFAFLSDAVPMTASAYEWLPLGLNNAFVLVMAGTLVVTGFVNAGNMADGANGLFGTIALSFLSVCMTFDSASFAPIFIMSLLIFLTFNVATGRIFLGDFGAYGLSGMIAFCALEIYASGNVSLWFLGSLLAYPCIEMVRVIVVRALNGVSPFQSSDDHLHNYLYELLRKWGWNRTVANSTTGCLLGTVSAALPASLWLLGMFDLGSTTFWAYYFVMYLMLHLFFFAQLERALNEK
jgi:UDP-N-acetylmuramyl pentapeptide phosphotransferase/UDP-N-acetylglucosamine-1-phosphate transferase